MKTVISEQTKIDLIITELTRALEAAQREKRAAYTEEEEDEIVGEICLKD